MFLCFCVSVFLCFCVSVFLCACVRLGGGERGCVQEFGGLEVFLQLRFLGFVESSWGVQTFRLGPRAWSCAEAGWILLFRFGSPSLGSRVQPGMPKTAVPVTRPSANARWGSQAFFSSKLRSQVCGERAVLLPWCYVGELPKSDKSQAGACRQHFGEGALRCALWKTTCTSNTTLSLRARTDRSTRISQPSETSEPGEAPSFPSPAAHEPTCQLFRSHAAWSRPSCPALRTTRASARFRVSEFRANLGCAVFRILGIS